jgi:peptidoglycan-N-acetylglucosamine deacetylase
MGRGRDGVRCHAITRRRALAVGSLSLLGPLAGLLAPVSAQAYRPVTMAQEALPIGTNAAPPKRIALTFDDGNHSPAIPRLLDLLDREGVAVTFFPIGYWVKDHPALFQRMVDRHEVGNHTLNHTPLARLTDDNMRGEILGGVCSPLLRPPQGLVNPRVRAVAAELGKRVVLWDVDSRDWTGIPASQISSNVVNGAGDGKIVLMHIGYPNTVDALPSILQQLRARGFTFVVVSALLK